MSTVEIVFSTTKPWVCYQSRVVAIVCFKSEKPAGEYFN